MNESCARYLELMSGFLDGELPDAEVHALEAHLAGCADCRLALDQMRANDDGLRAVVAHASSSREEVEALQRTLVRLEGEPAPEWQRARRRSRWNWSVTLRWSAGIAAAAAAVLLVMRLGPAPTAPIRARSVAPSHEVAVPAPVPQAPAGSAETPPSKTVTTQSAPTSSPERPAGVALRDEAETGSATDRMKGEATHEREVEKLASKEIEPVSPTPPQATGPAASATTPELKVAQADQGETGPSDAAADQEAAGRTAVGKDQEGVAPSDAAKGRADTAQPEAERDQAEVAQTDAAKAERADRDAAARAEEKDRPMSTPKESDPGEQASNAPAPERPGTSTARESRDSRSGRVAPTGERSLKSAPPPAGSSSFAPSKSNLSGGTAHTQDGTSSAYFSYSGAPPPWYMTIAETDTIVSDLSWRSRLENAEVELVSRAGAILPADERARRYHAIGDLWEWFGRRTVDPFASMHAMKCYSLAVKNDPEAAALDSTRVQRARAAVFGSQKIKPANR